MGPFVIRAERAEDLAAVRRINELAFGQPGEADLVDALRGVVEPLVSLVAERDGGLLGHVLFTSVTIETPEGGRSAMALGPVAVLPEHHRQGIGDALCRRGLEACRELGIDLVFVLGHAQYYPRFGFETAAEQGFRCEWNVPDEAFMVVRLRPGAGEGLSGLVRYHSAFSEV